MKVSLGRFTFSTIGLTGTGTGTMVDRPECSIIACCVNTGRYVD